MKVDQLPTDWSYVLRLLVACEKCASVLAAVPEQTKVAIGNRNTDPNSTERNFEVFIRKARFVFDGGTGEPFAGAVAGGDPVEANFLRCAYFHDESLSAPNAQPMPYEEVKRWFAEECEQGDIENVEALEREFRGRLDRLGVKLSSVPQMPPKTEYLAQRESLSRIKRVGDFRNAIINLRHGLCLCDACDLGLKAVIEGAHVHQVFENGDFDPCNGLLFCANHHRMWDRGLFAIDAENGTIVQAKALNNTAHGITRVKIPGSSFNLVDKKKLKHRWDTWVSSGNAMNV